MSGGLPVPAVFDQGSANVHNLACAFHLRTCSTSACACMLAVMFQGRGRTFRGAARGLGEVEVWRAWDPRWWWRKKEARNKRHHYQGWVQGCVAQAIQPALLTPVISLFLVWNAQRRPQRRVSPKSFCRHKNAVRHPPAKDVAYACANDSHPRRPWGMPCVPCQHVILCLHCGVCPNVYAEQSAARPRRAAAVRSYRDANSDEEAGEEGEEDEDDNKPRAAQGMLAGGGGGGRARTVR